MIKKQTGWPFQEGYTVADQTEVHIFTDYRWNDGSVIRRWHVDPNEVEYRSVQVRQFSLETHVHPDQ